MITVRRHYAFVTRMLLELHDEGRFDNIASVEVEPEYGYATKITYRNGTERLTYGNNVGLNPSGASDIVKDKAYTKFFLTSSGFNCPAGSSFVLRWWSREIGERLTERGLESMSGAPQAVPFIRAELDYPVYVKPNEGSQGANVFRCECDAEVDEAMDALEANRVKVAIVEETVELPDYRLVILDGEVVFVYRRLPLSVLGDGSSTIGELCERLWETFKQQDRDASTPLQDPAIERRLRREGLTWSSVPAAGERVALLDQSNLSLGGSAEEVTDAVDEHWASLGAEVAKSLRMRFCGVDLACADLGSADSTYAIFEVNAAPGLNHFAALGPTQRAKVRDLYVKVFDAPPP